MDIHVSSRRQGFVRRWKTDRHATFNSFFDRDTCPALRRRRLLRLPVVLPGHRHRRADLRHRRQPTDGRRRRSMRLDYVVPAHGARHHRRAADHAREPDRRDARHRPADLVSLWPCGVGSRGVDALLLRHVACPRRAPQREASSNVAGLRRRPQRSRGAIFVVIALLTVAGLPALIPWPSRRGVVLILADPLADPARADRRAFSALLYRWGPTGIRESSATSGRAPSSPRCSGCSPAPSSRSTSRTGATTKPPSARSPPPSCCCSGCYNSAQILVLGAAFNTEIERATTASRSSDPR